jgi:hypothetical protein
VSRFQGKYPADWPDVARAVKETAGWRCVRCDHPHAPDVGRCLTVHHLDGDKSNSRWWNLAALCQACHLAIQGRVRMDQAYLHPHTPWFRPYVAGFYAWTVLGEDLTRAEVQARLDELLLVGQPWLEGVAYA